MIMPLAEEFGDFKRRGGRAAMMQGDGWGKVVGGQKLGLGHSETPTCSDCASRKIESAGCSERRRTAGRL